MSAFAAVIVLSMGVMLSTAVTVATFAYARRRPALYLFSGVCVAGAIYSLASLAQLRVAASTTSVVAAAQLGYVSACVYIALNLVFLSRYTKTPLAPWERWIGLGLPGVIGVLVCVPGLFFEVDRIRTFEVLGSPHLSTVPTTFAFVPVGGIGLALVALASVAYRLRRSFFQSVPMIASLILLAVFGILDMLVTLCVLELPYVGATAGVAVSLAMAAQLASEWGEEARQLVGLRRTLEQSVEEKSDALRDAQSRLARKDRLEFLGRIAASVGHEVNNPLTYVLGNLALLDEHDLDADARELLAQSREGATRIARIVRDLRSLSHQEPPSRRPVLLREPIDAAVRTLGHRLGAHASVDIEVPTDLRVLADDTQLTQIFVNLVANAIDAFEDDGPRGIDIKATTRGDTAIVRVSNDGAPIPDVIRDQLFEPFRSTKDEGLGLGLSIVHNLVTAFDGSIRLVPDAPRTTFVIELPRCDEAPAAPSPRDDVRSRLARLEILVVDDQTEVAKAIERMLRPARVTRALNGFAALEAIEEHRFDLVICDVMMPELTGLDVLARLRERGTSLPAFVFMTGGATTPQLELALERTDVPVLYKPFSRAEVLELVDTLL